MLAIAQAGECLGSQRPFWCWKPFQGEKRRSEAHTKTCQCTICNNNFQQAQSLDVKEWSTAKIKLVPQGQRDRPHWSKRTVKIKLVPQGQRNRPHWSKCTVKNKIVPQGQSDRPRQRKRTAKNKLLPRSQQNRLQIRRSQKSKSTCLKVTKIDLY